MQIQMRMIKFRFVTIIVVLLLVCCCAQDHAQTPPTPATCSVTNPCVAVSVTNAAAVGQTVSLFSCGGTCTAATLAAFLANPTAASPWSILATFPQKAATAVYNDPKAYGTQVSYAALDTPSGGAAGPPSPVVVFQVPSAPQAPPSVTAGPGIVTNGATVGPQ